MSEKKNFIVTVLFCVFLVLAGAQFATQILSNLHSDIYFYTIFPKYAMILICAAVAWTAGKDTFAGRDIIFIRILFLGFAAADLAMVVLSEFNPVFSPVGIGLFMIVQIVLISRHSWGLAEYIRSMNSKKILLLVLSAAAVLFMSETVVYVLADQLREHGFLIPCIFYAAFLGGSLWTGWLTLFSGKFPEVNSRIIAAAVTCFYLCDIMVIISITDNGIAGLIGRNMAWVFYTPTIILLALSTYNFTGFRKTSDSR
jgi:hypothetical protein